MSAIMHLQIDANAREEGGGQRVTSFVARRDGEGVAEGG